MSEDWEKYVRQRVEEHSDMDKLTLRVGKTVYQLWGLDQLIVYTKGNEPGALDMTVHNITKYHNSVFIGAMIQGVRFGIEIYYSDVESVN